MNRTEKQAVVEELRSTFQKAESAIFVDFRGLSVAEMTELRERIRNGAGRMLVLKNTLARIASRGTGFEEVDSHLQGPIAMVYGSEVTGSAKILTNFAKDYGKLDIRFCVLQGKLLEAEEVQDLARLPSLDELRSQLIGLIQQPLANLIAQVQAPSQQLVAVLQAWLEEREKGGEESGEG